MFYENNDTLRGYLKRGAAEAYHKLIECRSFLFDNAAFAKALGEVRQQFAHLSEDEAKARAAFRLLTSGAPPSVARPVLAWHAVLREWAKVKAVNAWPWVKIAWGVIVLALLWTLLARAEPTPQNIQAYRNALRRFSLLAAQQPNGLILQFQQAGSTVAIRPQGLVTFNCATNMTCSWSGNTFTLSSGGGSGSGCVPSGGTANALLYDTGSGTCDDVAKITWTSGTSTLLGASGLNADFSAASTFKFKFGAASTITNAGGSGQALLSNGDGTATFADPIVSGPDARGAAQSKNPVAGLAGIDYGTGCVGSPCVQEGKIDSSGNLYIGNFPSGFNVNNTPAVTQSGTWTVQQGGAPWSVSQSGNWTSRIVGNAGGALDAAGQNAASPANELLAGCQFNTTPTTITSGNISPCQFGNSKGFLGSVLMDAAGNIRGANVNSSNQLSVSVDGFTATNASVNLAQVAGNATLTGNGASGSDAQRVNISSDNSAIANWGQGATGSAVPSGAQQIAGVGSGNLTAPLACDGYAFYDASTNGATQLVALTSGQTIYVCGYSFTSSSTTANTLKLVYGTGTNCATGQTAMTPGAVLQAASSTGPIGKVIPVSGWSRGLKTAASDALCVLTNAAAAAQAEVWYTKF